MYCYIPAAPRLACVRPVASVHPEPGSNSSLYISFFIFFYFKGRPERSDARLFRLALSLFWRWLVFCIPCYRDTRLVLLSSIVMLSRILFCFPLLWSESGAKIMLFCFPFQIFRSFFHFFFLPLSAPEKRCKDKAFYSPFPNFLSRFLCKFLRLFTSIYFSNACRIKKFRTEGRRSMMLP